MFAGETAVADGVLDEAATDDTGCVLGIVVVECTLVEALTAQ